MGVTNDVARRLTEHATGTGFTSRDLVDRLVYVEEHARAVDTIAREKQIKGWPREKKVDITSAANLGWVDLNRHADA